MSKVEKIVHWLRWNFTPQYGIEQSGGYVVLYPDGERSRAMSYRSALALANIEGGMVAYDPKTEDTNKWRCEG